MKKIACLALVAPFALATAAQATVLSQTISDPVGDFMGSFVGAQTPDLDVTSFTVAYDDVAAKFTLSATMAGAINPASGALYVIGANTGTGVNHPFGGLTPTQGNVLFNQVIIVRANGTGSLGANVLDPNVTISGNMFSVSVLASLLPSTGFTPEKYGFNLWPRNSTNSISDFAPENSTLAAVPEPGSWAMLVAGFAGIGIAMRRRRPRLALRFS